MTWFSLATRALLKVTGAHGLMVNVVRAPLGSALLWLNNTLRSGPEVLSFETVMRSQHN